MSFLQKHFFIWNPRLTPDQPVKFKTVNRNKLLLQIFHILVSLNWGIVFVKEPFLAPFFCQLSCRSFQNRHNSVKKVKNNSQNWTYVIPTTFRRNHSSRSTAGPVDAPITPRCWRVDRLSARLKLVFNDQ